MRFYYVFFLLFMLTSGISAQHKIIINVSNVRSDKGRILLSLFNNATGWPGDLSKTFKQVIFPVKDGKAHYVFENMPTGNYAIAIMFDENNNEEMDYTFLHFPKEGYGFSNNVMGTFGPPSFKEAVFKVNTDTPVALKLKYWNK